MNTLKKLIVGMGLMSVLCLSLPWRRSPIV
jgi:hypothetical protein